MQGELLLRSAAGAAAGRPGVQRQPLRRWRPGCEERSAGGDHHPHGRRRAVSAVTGHVPTAPRHRRGRGSAQRRGRGYRRDLTQLVFADDQERPAKALQLSESHVFVSVYQVIVIFGPEEEEEESAHKVGDEYD